MITELNPSLQDQKNPCFPITITYLMRLHPRQKASDSSFTRRRPQRSKCASYSHLFKWLPPSFNRSEADLHKAEKIGTIGVRTHLLRRQNHRISDLPSPVAYTPNKHHKSKDKRPICSMEQKSSRSDVSHASRATDISCRPIHSPQSQHAPHAPLASSCHVSIIEWSHTNHCWCQS